MEILKYLVIAFVAYNIVSALRTSELRREGYQMARALRPKHFLRAVPTMALVIVTGSLLSQLPVLEWGWWSMLGGEGSIVAGDTGGGGGAEVVSLLVLTLVAVALPLFALAEEQIFRKGAEYRSRGENLWAAFVFGMVHALMGIPLGWAVALTLGGVLFTRVYLKAYRRAEKELPEGERAGEREVKHALFEAGRVHLAWNMALISIALVGTIAAVLV